MCLCGNWLVVPGEIVWFLLLRFARLVLFELRLLEFVLVNSDLKLLSWFVLLLLRCDLFTYLFGDWLLVFGFDCGFVFTVLVGC